MESFLGYPDYIFTETYLRMLCQCMTHAYLIYYTNKIQIDATWNKRYMVLLLPFPSSDIMY